MTESNIILYTTPNGQVNVQVQYEDGSFWLTQKRMAELFGVDVRTVNEHLGNIYASNKLSHEATVRKIRIVQREGSRSVSRELDFYNLDAIITVGYRVNSYQVTQFRIVSAYLDLAENRAARGITTNMQEWVWFLNQFLDLSEYPILQDKERVSALEARLKAEQEYGIYRKTQDENYISDFDREVKRIESSHNEKKQ